MLQFFQVHIWPLSNEKHFDPMQHDIRFTVHLLQLFKVYESLQKHMGMENSTGRVNLRLGQLDCILYIATLIYVTSLANVALL